MKMRLQVGDPPQGWAESSDQQVQVGDRLVPASIDVDFSGAGGQPALRMRLEVVDGVPSCRSVELVSVPGGRAVKELDFRAIRLAEWVDDIYAMFSARVTGPGTAVYQVPGGDQHFDSVRAFQAARKGKSARKLTSDFLAGVAEVYRENITGNPTQAVAATYGVAQRTAADYVKRCRDPEVGLLAPTTKGKKGV